MTEKFIQHRVYLTGVSEQTVKRYRWSFKAFDGCLDSKDAVVERIAQLKGRGVNHITINSYLRAVNAYFMWLHTEHGKEKLRIPKLKEEQKILSTLSTRRCICHCPVQSSRYKPPPCPHVHTGCAGHWS